MEKLKINFKKGKKGKEKESEGCPVVNLGIICPYKLLLDLDKKRKRILSVTILDSLLVGGRIFAKFFTEEQAQVF